MLAAGSGAGAAELAAAPIAPGSTQTLNSVTFTSIFPPVFVPAPPIRGRPHRFRRLLGELNQLLQAEDQFAEVAVALEASEHRAQEALGAGDPASLRQQQQAEGDYAIRAGSLLQGVARLQSAFQRALAISGPHFTVTEQQFAAVQARLVRRLPGEITHELQAEASVLRPRNGPEVTSMRATILAAQAVRAAIAQQPPTTLEFPQAIDSQAFPRAERRAAISLVSFGQSLLMRANQARDRAVVADEGAAEILEGIDQAATTFTEGGAAASVGAAVAKGFGLEQAAAGFEGASEVLGGAGEGAEYVFAAGVFNEVSNTFTTDGANPGDAASYGEPHEVTFSGGDYVFQAVGEFTLVKSRTDNLEIQVRQQPFPGTGDVAVDTAVAMRDGRAIVELAGTNRGRLQLWIDRKQTSLKGRALAGGGRLSVANPEQATVTWPDGTHVSVDSETTVAITSGERATCNAAGAIDVQVAVPHSRFGHLTGLLGDPGAAFGADMSGGDGRRYNPNVIDDPSLNTHNFDVLYHQFGQSWRIKQRDSLFEYPKGESTASFTKPDFPSRALTIESLAPTTAASAERVCLAAGVHNPALLADCVLDVGVTGQTCFADGAAQIQSTTGGPAATNTPSSGAPPPTGSTTTVTTPTGTTPTRTTTTGTTPTPTPPAGGPPITIGTNSLSLPSQPAVAVDSSGTAYIAWLQPNGTQIDFCTMPTGATGCSPVALKVPDPSTDAFFDPPSVLLAGGQVYVFEYVHSTSNDDNTGFDEYVSSDGGSTFTPHTDAVSYMFPYSGTSDPVIALPNSIIGVGGIAPGANPGFQANSLSSPSNDSAATSPPFATLDPSPDSYQVGNLDGQFAAQPTGSMGVLGVFGASPGSGSSPCPSSAPAALVYAYAPITSSTTIAQLDKSPGVSGSPWRALAEVDCEGENPAVSGGPSGLGLLETDASTPGGTVQYRSFTPPSTFAAPVNVAAGEVANSPTLSQDGAGGIYATWLDNSTGVQLAFSSDGGNTWVGPNTLRSSNGGIGSVASAVNAAGQGWVVYALKGSEYAQQFSSAQATP